MRAGHKREGPACSADIAGAWGIWEVIEPAARSGQAYGKRPLPETPAPEPDDWWRQKLASYPMCQSAMLEKPGSKHILKNRPVEGPVNSTS
jgi:hypothetical protein